MGLNLSNPVDLYAQMQSHVGHTIVMTSYAKGENVAIECEECGEVLLDCDRPCRARVVYNVWNDELDVDDWSCSAQDALTIATVHAGTHVHVTRYTELDGRVLSQVPNRITVAELTAIVAAEQGDTGMQGEQGDTGGYAPLLDGMRQQMQAFVESDVDEDDAAWELVCEHTNALPHEALVMLTRLAFPSLSTAQVLARYADAGHDSDGAILQSALMEALKRAIKR